MAVVAKTSTANPKNLRTKQLIRDADQGGLGAFKLSCDKDGESRWKVVNYKRSYLRTRKTLITGTYSESSEVEGLDRFRTFHVSNLKPDTTIENLRNILQRNFSNFTCEKLDSRYLEYYSSFKVLIPASDNEKALGSSKWPNKANVNRFFRRRKLKDRQD